jgi:hypothetical protein
MKQTRLDQDAIVAIVALLVIMMITVTGLIAWAVVSR